MPSQPTLNLLCVSVKPMHSSSHIFIWQAQDHNLQSGFLEHDQDLKLSLKTLQVQDWQNLCSVTATIFINQLLTSTITTTNTTTILQHINLC